MLLMSGNVFNNNDYDATYDWLMSLILIALVIFFFFFFVLQGLQALYKVIKDFRKGRRTKKDAENRLAIDKGDDLDDDIPLSTGLGSPGSKPLQSQAEWVDQYKAGVDVTASLQRSDIRRKVTATKRLTQDEDVVLARNPAWSGHHGEMSQLTGPGATQSVNASNSSGASTSSPSGSGAVHGNGTSQSIQL